MKESGSAIHPGGRMGPIGRCETRAGSEDTKTRTQRTRRQVWEHRGQAALLRPGDDVECPTRGSRCSDDYCNRDLRVIPAELDFIHDGRSRGRNEPGARATRRG